MKHAFTLIEMLVVIAIIAVLAGLLFPVLSQGHTRAKEESCISNIRQIFIAAKLYEADSGDYPPNGFYWSMQNGTELARTLRCPAQQVKAAASDYVIHGPPSADIFGPELLRDVARCREVRGDQVPVVSDTNHNSTVYGYQKGRRPVFLMRETGGLSVVDGEVANAKLAARDIPCTSELGAWNY